MLILQLNRLEYLNFMMMNIAIFNTYYEWERFAKIVTRDTFI